MNWYYVDAGQQAGPVDDAQLDELLRSGKIQQDTLIWRDGMANWLPYAEARTPAPPIVAPPVTLPPPSAGGTGEATREAVCLECGRIFNMDDMIRHGEGHVCAGCKPIFMQKLSEGLVTTVRRGRRTLPVNAEELMAEVTARGYEINIGSCLSRGWNTVKTNYGLCIGATFLVLLCNQAAGFLPFIGIILSLLVQGPLLGGLNIFFLKLIRGEQAGLGDAFSGFSKAFWRLCGTMILMMLLLYVWFIPLGIYAVFFMDSQGTGAIFWILLALGFIAMMYFAVSFFFGLPLCADLELGPWDALRVSRRIISRKWLRMFRLLVAAGLVSMLGLVVCIIGVIFTMPILYAATLHAYEDIFGVAPAANEPGR